MRFLAIIAALLAGCGSGGGGGGDNHGYGWHVDEVGASGLQLQYRAGPFDPDAGTTQHLEQEFAGVMECTGIQAEPPFVAFVMSADLWPEIGHTYFEPPLVVVDNSIRALRHEYVHYLLAQINYPRADNIDHRSELFSKCGKITS